MRVVAMVVVCLGWGGEGWGIAAGISCRLSSLAVLTSIPQVFKLKLALSAHT